MELTRWVSYIYRYRENTDEKKCENAGFVKVQQLMKESGKRARIQLGLRLHKPYDCSCNVYLTRQGKVQYLNRLLINAGERDVATAKQEVGWNKVGEDAYGIVDYEGVLFVCQDGERLFASWSDNEINPYDIQVADEPAEMNTANMQSVVGNGDGVRSLSGMGTDDGVRSLSALGQVAVSEEQCVNRKASDRLSWRELFIVREKIPDIEIEGRREGQTAAISGVKISTADIGLLPSVNWKLGVNSFLAHGYYRYNYLMLGKLTRGDKISYIVGVPGNDSRRERYMAGMFGFRNFVRAGYEAGKNSNLGSFGYWITIVKTDDRYNEADLYSCP